MENHLDLLFTDESSGLPEANKSAKLLESFRIILKRDPGRGVDKIKEIARKEFAYIYFSVKKDFFEGYSEEERNSIIKERVALPDKWNPDETVKQAIKDIKQDSVSTVDKLLASAKQNLEDYITLFDEIRNYNRKLIVILQESTEENPSPEAIKERKDAIEQAQGYFGKLTKSIKDIKEGIELVDQLEQTRRVTKKKEGRKTVSKFETDHDLYTRDN